MGTDRVKADTERRLGKYRLIDLMERDGDARLHRAVDLANGRSVALWIIPLSRFRNAETALERFRREAAALAHLSHPGIPAVLASGEHDGAAFVATEPVDGPTLADRLRTAPAADLADSVATLDRVLDAMVGAHRAGVVHGTLSAETVRLPGRPAQADRAAGAVVTGFGMAALRTPQATAVDDRDAALDLTERLLRPHQDRPGVAALLSGFREAAADPDLAALRRAVLALTEPPPTRRRRSLWLGAAALMIGAVATVAVLHRPPVAPSLPAPAEGPRRDTAATPPAPATVPPQSEMPKADGLPPAPPVAAPPLPLPQPDRPPDHKPARPPVAAVSAAMRSLPCALVTVEDSNNRLFVSGTVAGERTRDAVRDALEVAAQGWSHGLEVTVADASLCGALSIAAPALDANRGLGTPLRMTLAEDGPEDGPGPENGPELRAGEALVLDVVAPVRPVTLRVDYFTVDGGVVHLLPNPLQPDAVLAAGAMRRLGERGDGGRYWTIGAPFGSELLLAFATATPLFPTERPEQEPAADYLAALAEALAARPDDEPAPLAAARFLHTKP